MPAECAIRIDWGRSAIGNGFYCDVWSRCVELALLDLKPLLAKNTGRIVTVELPTQIVDNSVEIIKISRLKPCIYCCSVKLYCFCSDQYYYYLSAAYKIIMNGLSNLICSISLLTFLILTMCISQI